MLNTNLNDNGSVLELSTTDEPVTK